MRGLISELEHSFRSSARAPLSVLATVASLSMGIATLVAVWAFVDHTLLRPLPGHNPRELVGIATFSYKNSRFLESSVLDYEDYRRDVGDALDLAAYFSVPFSVIADRTPFRCLGEIVSDNYFEVLGITMRQGRALSEAPDPEIVVSHGFWRDHIHLRDLGLDDARIWVNDTRVRVVGVVPEGFYGLSLDRESDVGFWVPLSSMSRLMPGFRRAIEYRGARWLTLFARLKPDTSVEAARARLTVIGRRLEESFPDTNQGTTAVVVPGNQARLSPRTRSGVVAFSQVLVVVGVLAFIMACFNAAILQVLRLLRRDHEMAVRAAVGATPGRLVARLVVDGLVLTLAGLFLSLPMAYWMMRLLERFGSPSGATLNLELAISDSRVFLGAALIVALASLAAAVLPALQVGGDGYRLLAGTRHSLRPGGIPRRRLGSLAIAAQVSVAMTLLVSAVLFLLTLRASLSIDPGLDTRRVTGFSLDLNAAPAKNDEVGGLALYRTLLERVAVLPGVEAASWGGSPPFSPRILRTWFRPEGVASAVGEEWTQTDGDIVGPDYFETLGIPLVEGRGFEAIDSENSVGVAVVNEAFARQYLDSRAPIGQRLVVRGRPRELYEVIGVARNSKYRSPFESPIPYLYLPLFQRYFPEMTLYVRAAQPGGSLIPAVREAVASGDRDLPLFDVQSLHARLERFLREQYAGAGLAGAASVLALLLALVGVYAVTAHANSARRRELAIRIALGARPATVLWSLMIEGTMSVLMGVLVGAIGSYLAASYLHSSLHGIAPEDAVARTASALVLIAASIATCYAAATRVVSKSPADLLRMESEN